eukprot:3770111-Prymnesium_polylepis.1
MDTALDGWTRPWTDGHGPGRMDTALDGRAQPCTGATLAARALLRRGRRRELDPASGEERVVVRAR